MSRFLRLLGEDDKAAALKNVCARVRAGESDSRSFSLQHDAFGAVPGKPFAYWVSETVRQTFTRMPSFAEGGRLAQRALSTNDDFRFLRLWWERDKDYAATRPASGWLPFVKGGGFSRFYADVYLLVNWLDEGREIEADALRKFPYLNGNAEWVLHRECNYLHPGITWPLRTTSFISLRAMPAGCIFGHKGPAAFVSDDNREHLLALLACTNSKAFSMLVSLQLAAADAAARSYEIGVIQKTPVPILCQPHLSQLAILAIRAWSLRRTLDSINETSHAFVLPPNLRSRLDDYDPLALEAELAACQAEIDDVAFNLYEFSVSDRASAMQPFAGAAAAAPNSEINELTGVGEGDDEGEEEETAAGSATTDSAATLGSWAVGVVFGRFDWHLAVRKRAAPPEPDPFDPLPAKSPGMLPEGAEPFHTHTGILVDDLGHPHDLAHLIEEVLLRIEAPVPDNVRRWLQRVFFPFHLQRYSRSRRKAPIYWPLATASAGYTLWLYYPSLGNQTLYTAINDFVEPKLRQVAGDIAALRDMGRARSRDDERRFDTLQTLELELIELRDTLLRIAPGYQPNHDDGVQITAAPLWPLFRHKPWQKLLKETWAKLEKGDYDWAHLAMNYWPDRVREKCKTDKSLAIAHGLESLYVEPEAKPKKTRAKQRNGA